MYTQINKEELRREWVLGNFWDKLIYCVGVFFSGYMAIIFVAALIEEALK